MYICIKNIYNYRIGETYEFKYCYNTKYGKTVFMNTDKYGVNIFDDELETYFEIKRVNSIRNILN